MAQFTTQSSMRGRCTEVATSADVAAVVLLAIRTRERDGRFDSRVDVKRLNGPMLSHYPGVHVGLSHAEGVSQADRNPVVW